MSAQMIAERETATIAGPHRDDRDLHLVEALRLRTPAAAERLVATYGERAYRLAVSITGNASDAEEVVQDAMWAVIRKIDSFRGESAFGSWFYRIVSNAAYQKRRSPQNARQHLSLDDVLPSFDECGAHVMPTYDVQTQLRASLTAAIDELPPLYRSVLVLRDVEGLSNLEIAELLGLSVPTVKTRVHRARLFIRKELGDALTA
jgi:RNA polymerase sigma-70 factor (ECF subfamily)